MPCKSRDNASALSINTEDVNNSTGGKDFKVPCFPSCAELCFLKRKIKSIAGESSIGDS